jgi:hypothetical protein
MVQSTHLSIPLFVLATICRLVENLSWLTSILVFFSLSCYLDWWYGCLNHLHVLQ